MMDFLIYLVILAALGLRRARLFSRCSEWGLLSSGDAEGFSLEGLLLLQTTGSRAQ